VVKRKVRKVIKAEGAIPALDSHNTATNAYYVGRIGPIEKGTDEWKSRRQWICPILTQ
jgi:hypothetical protein